MAHNFSTLDVRPSKAFLGRRVCGDLLCCADLLCYAEQEASVFARQRTRSSKITLRTRTGCETEQGIPKQFWSRSSSAFDMRIETLGDTPLPRRAKALRAMIASYTATHLPYGLPWSIALRLPVHPQHVENPVGHPHLRPFPARIVNEATFIQA